MLDATEVQEATKFLLLEHIPAFAFHLDRKWSEKSNGWLQSDAMNKPLDHSLPDLRSSAMFSFLASLRNDAHGHGINMRLLGQSK